MTTNDQPANTGKMKLYEYLQGIGRAPQDLPNAIGMPPAVFHRITEGHPIAASYARKIARYLSEHYEQQIEVEDIADIKILTTGKEHTEVKKV